MSCISNKAISDYLGEKGISHAKIGYKYLMLAIRAMLDGKVDRYNVRSIYIYVSTQTGIHYGSIDKSMRTVILETPTPVNNKEFLNRALDDLLLSEDANAGLFESPSPP